jgi:hypothetical protein
MKFASLLIDMNFIGQAEEQSTQRKKINRYAIFFTINARRACFLLFSGVPVPFCGVNENNKINNLSVLCDSNERSEWAVNINFTYLRSKARTFSFAECLID